MKDQPTPTWRYFVPGLLFLGLALYLLWSGEMAIDKQRTMTITRAGNPLLYWSSVAVSGAIGVLAMRKAWQRVHPS
jgi:hypothetical protein